MSAQPDWNDVVTVHEEGFKPAKRVLREAGPISTTDYHHVLVMKVADLGIFTNWLAERVAEQPGLLDDISRVVPAAQVFHFHDAEEFARKARQAVLGFVPALAGKSFHVRMHRRGFRHQLSAQEEERRIGAAIFEALEAAGTPAKVAFDDPDTIVVIETVGPRAGISLFTREDMQRCPFLRFDRPFRLCIEYDRQVLEERFVPTYQSTLIFAVPGLLPQVRWTLVDLAAGYAAHMPTGKAGWSGTPTCNRSAPAQGRLQENDKRQEARRREDHDDDSRT